MLFILVILHVFVVEVRSQTFLGAGYVRRFMSAEMKGREPSFADGLSLGLFHNFKSGHVSKIFTGLCFISEFGIEPARKWDDIILDQRSYSEMALFCPFLLNVAFPISKQCSFFLFGGPSSRVVLLSKINNLSQKEQNRYGQNRDYRRLNVYAGGGVGLDFDRVFFYCGYRQGMRSLYTHHSCNDGQLDVGICFNI